MSVAISDMQAVSFTRAVWKARLSAQGEKKVPTMKLACSEEGGRDGWPPLRSVPLGYVSSLHNGFKISNKLPAIIFG